MPYRPDYGPGQVIVHFRENYANDRVAQCLARDLGYECAGEYCGAYVFNVPVGQEDECLRRIKKRSLLVEMAERRDSKFDSCAEACDRLEALVNEVASSDNPERRPKKWKKSLDKLIAEAKKARKLI